MSTKLPLSILALIFCTATASSVNGQLATDPNLQSNTPEPAPPKVKVPERAQIDEIFKESSLGKEADERRLHIEWRQLQNEVVNDVDVVAAKRAAETARTDLEKRERLRDYYNLYYGRMRTLARSAQMKNALDELKTAHLGQLTQARVRHETDSELPTPSPTPKKKKENKHERKFQGQG